MLLIFFWQPQKTSDFKYMSPTGNRWHSENGVIWRQCIKREVYKENSTSSLPEIGSADCPCIPWHARHRGRTRQAQGNLDTSSTGMEPRKQFLWSHFPSSSELLVCSPLAKSNLKPENQGDGSWNPNILGCKATEYGDEGWRVELERQKEDIQHV